MEEARFSVPTLPALKKKDLKDGTRISIATNPRKAGLFRIDVGLRHQYRSDHLSAYGAYAFGIMINEDPKLVSRMMLAGVDFSIGSSGYSLTAMDLESAKPLVAELHRRWTAPTADFWSAKTLETARKSLLSGVLSARDSQGSVAKRNYENLVNAARYGTDGYSYSFDQIEEYVRALTPESVRAVHATWVRPADIVVSAVADSAHGTLPEIGTWLTAMHTAAVASKAAAAVEQFSLGSGAIPSPSSTAEPAWMVAPNKRVEIGPEKFNALVTSKAASVLDTDMDRDLTYVMMVRPAALTSVSPDMPLLAMVDHTLFSSIGSKLYNMRETDGLFYGAGGEIGCMSSEHGSSDCIRTEVDPSKVDEFVMRTRAMLKDIKETGGTGDNEITDADLRNAKISILDGYGMSWSTPAGISATQLFLAKHDLAPSYYSKALGAIESMSLDGMRAMVSKYAGPDDFTVFTVGKQG
jgi:predicted Zn-dependent peptidase